MLCVRSIDGESVVLSFHRSPMNAAVLKFNKIFLWNFFDELNSGKLFSQYGTEYWSEKNIRFYVSTQHIPIFSRKKNWFLEPTLNYMYQTRFCSYVPLFRHFIVNEFKSPDFFFVATGFNVSRNKRYDNLRGFLQFLISFCWKIISKDDEFTLCTLFQNKFLRLKIWTLLIQFNYTAKQFHFKFLHIIVFPLINLYWYENKQDVIFYSQLQYNDF